MRPLLLSWIIAGAACAGEPSELEGQDPARDELQAPAESGDRLAPAMLDDRPGREVAPLLLEPVPVEAEATAESTIATFSRRAQAVAVVRIDSATAFETEEPPFLSTRYALTAVRVISGEPPATVVVRGGVLGDLTVVNSELPDLAVGGSYLAFFWPGPQLVFAPVLSDAEHARVLGKSVSLEVVPALVQQASTGGAL